ncbi:MAG: UDP-2,3-diacylglucosamine diphosphatase LpxI [Thalassobaculaceae bacterium]
MTGHPKGGLGILAGGGSLPRRIAETARDAGRPVFVIAFDGQTDPATVDGLPHAWMRLGATTKTLQALHAAGCGEVVMAGPMKRPALSSLGLDLRSTAAIARAGARVFGDDGLLSLIVEEMERDGFTVIGIEDVLGGYLAPSGTLTAIAPDDRALADARRGIATLSILARADIGQAVVVQEGLVLAVEAVEGTDAMIARAGSLRREAAAPVLIKGRKLGQNDRVDRPTVGPATVAAAGAAGLAGIVIEAGQTLIVDRPATVAAADAAGLFLHAMPFEGAET